MISSLRIPVIVAPMAGGVSTPGLVAAVGDAGGFGFLAGGYLAPEALDARIAEVRDRTDSSFGVNLFVPGEHTAPDLSAYRRRLAEVAASYQVEPGVPHWDDDDYPAKLRLLADRRVPVVSFTFGCPSPEVIRGFRDDGTEVVVTVTTPEEAVRAAEAGANTLCVQGFEAGGHRGSFTDDGVSEGGGPLYGLLVALRLISSVVDLPLVAAGGLAHGADVAAVLTSGAVAAQLGTAFLDSTEAGTVPAQRAALTQNSRGTMLTRAFTGRPARGLVNDFMTELGANAPAAYPQLHHMTKPVRAAAGAAGDPESMSLWAGQGYPLTRALPAADIVRRLDEQARTALAGVSTRYAAKAGNRTSGPPYRLVAPGGRDHGPADSGDVG